MEGRRVSERVRKGGGKTRRDETKCFSFEAKTMREEERAGFLGRENTRRVATEKKDRKKKENQRNWKEKGEGKEEEADLNVLDRILGHALDATSRHCSFRAQKLCEFIFESLPVSRQKPGRHLEPARNQRR